MNAIIFDFDGVIVDTESKRFKDINKLLADEGFLIKEDEFHDFIGKKTAHFLKEKFPELGKEKIEKISEKRRKLELEDFTKLELIEGIVPLLEWLKNEKCVLAICTGSKKKFVEQILMHHGLQKYFDVVVTGEDFSSSKPNPEGFKLASKKLYLSERECLVIEDSPAGIEAAKNAGMKVYAIESYFSKEKLIGADKVFRNHAEILGFYKNEKN